MNGDGRGSTGTSGEGDALERRYRRLMRAYPARYRADRGAEILATYLEIAPPGRRWPSLLDAADVLAAGVQVRTRATSLSNGARLAGIAALALAGVLAAVYLPLEMQPPDWWVADTFGPFTTVGVVVWPAWLAALLGAALLPGRWARWPVGAALALTAAALLAPPLSGFARPPLMVLLPQMALGAVALSLPARRGPVARVVVAAPLLVLPFRDWSIGYDYAAGYAYLALVQDTLPGIAVVTLAGFAVAGVAYLALRDARVLWAGVLLLPAAGLLSVFPIAQSALVDPSRNGGLQWNRLVMASGLVAAGSLAVFAAAMLLSALADHRRAATGQPCPACGRPTGTVSGPPPRVGL